MSELSDLHCTCRCYLKRFIIAQLQVVVVGVDGWTNNRAQRVYNKSLAKVNIVHGSVHAVIRGIYDH